jgi:hypothetical protein
MQAQKKMRVKKRGENNADIRGCAHKERSNKTTAKENFLQAKK